MLYFMIGVAVLFWAVVVWVLKRTPRAPENHILIDGSNVMFWDDHTPRIETVQDAVCLLVERGYTPNVMFDANAGYLVSERYQHDHNFAQMLGMPENQVIVVGKGVPADPFLLKAARQLDARIVTNDLFRDWAKDFPEVRNRGHLIHGGYHKGKLWLDFDGSRQRAQKHRRRKKR
ncbi:Zc3h12a-like ribonuclease protein [Litoreibacter halocynthiae]|uniref:Zc3h12a-like ribonuclease protein n=2 Tax=Litoreibacter halocynthiae TaxID=1242689 RepID=A0A4R7LIT9_9RHOB|nr:Zc3h12a-like ribonuclease protein [Litoreibacter halocynthiae]